MKRSIVAVLAAVTLALPIAASAQSAPATVVVNGQTMSFDQPPVTQAGRVFVPLRGVFQQLGASVVYANGQINATGHGRTISLQIGSTQATVNGQPQTLDVAPFLIGGTTLVPLRFIAQSLGASVNWNQANNTVYIQGSGQRPGPPPPPPQPQVSLIANTPTGTISTNQPTIRFQISRPTRLGSVGISIDGTSLTSQLQQQGNQFFVRTFTLQPMNHKVLVKGTTNGGVPFQFTWNFRTRNY